MIININKLKENPESAKKAGEYARSIFKQLYCFENTIQDLKKIL